MHYVKHEKEVAGVGYFHSLLEERKDCYTPAKKQIELDLLRTLPNNKFYDRVDSKGVSTQYALLILRSITEFPIGCLIQEYFWPNNLTNSIH